MSASHAASISKKRKFVADGVFQAEINEFFTRELAEEGYSGCEVRVTHARTEVRFSLDSLLSPTFFAHFYLFIYQIIIRATHTQEVLGEKGRRIRELTALVQKRFKVRLFFSPVLMTFPWLTYPLCSSPRTPSSFTLRRFRPEDFPPLPRLSLSDTSFSVDLPSDEPATESSDSLWSPVPRVARSLSLVSCELPEPSP